MAQELTYSDLNGYKIPNLALPDDGLGDEVEIGAWGQRLNYLKQHRRVLYSQLLTKGKLRVHLHEINITAHNQQECLIRQMAKTWGLTEQLKAEHQMLWVGKMNNICACVDEMIRDELIYS